MMLSGDIDVALGDRADLESGELLAVLKFTAEGHPEDMAKMPALADVARPNTPPELLQLVDTLDRTGRILLAAPSTDPGVVDALRAAFDKVAADPAFIDEMSKHKVVISPTPGSELGERLAHILDPASGIPAKFTEAVACGDKISDGATSCE
jgi:hypothetical protein